LKITPRTACQHVSKENKISIKSLSECKGYKPTTLGSL